MFATQGAPLVSTTPVANLPPVSMTPAANFATGTAGVVDTVPVVNLQAVPTTPVVHLKLQLYPLIF
jgi:hypothetical protein